MNSILETKKIITLLSLLCLVLISSIPGITMAQTPGTTSRSISEIMSEIDNKIAEAEEIKETGKELEEERAKIQKEELGFFSDTPGARERIREKWEEIKANNDKLLSIRQEDFPRLLEELSASGATDEEINVAANKINWELRTSKEENAVACWTLTGGFAIGACTTQIIAWVGTWVIYIIGSILFVAGSIFDFSIFISITKIGDWYFNNEAVSMIWRLSRDLANVFFIFILLYIAIGTIFNLGGVNDPKKLITNVIIIALLVNFSGFFVRVIVDASNVVAYEFYLSMSGDGGPTGLGNLGSNLVSKLAPERYMVKQSEAFGAEGIKRNKISVNGPSILGVIIEIVMAVIIIIIASFVLLVASILFIIRTIILVLLYMIAPLAFVSGLLPNKSYFSSWFNQLIKQSLYAPAFLVPFYFVYVLLDIGIFTGGTTEMKSALGFIASGTTTTALSGIMVMGLMVACIFIAQKVGVVGSTFATSMGSKATALASRPLSRYGGRMARGAGAYVAGTGAGKFISNQWNTGRLSRVRQSWDTGVLKDMRSTQAAQKVGQAMRNPLNVAGAGIGMAASRAGVKGMDNIFGKETFGKAVEEKGNKVLEDLNKIERDEDKVKFLEGLASSGRKEEFDYVYSKLNEEDRAKLELSARKTANNTSLSIEVRDMARKTLSSLEKSRENLKGKSLQKTTIELIKKAKTGGEMVDFVYNLKEDDFVEFYKGLNKEERVEFEKQAKTDFRYAGRIATLVATAKSRLKTKEAKETAREESKQQRIDNAGDSLRPGGTPRSMPAFSSVSGGTATPAEVARVDSIRNLNSSEFEEFSLNNNIFDGSHRDIYPYLTVEQLTRILSNNLAPRNERQQIRSAIDTNRGRAVNTDRTIEDAYQYLHDPTSNASRTF